MVQVSNRLQSTKPRWQDKSGPLHHSTAINITPSPTLMHGQCLLGSCRHEMLVYWQFGLDQACGWRKKLALLLHVPLTSVRHHTMMEQCAVMVQIYYSNRWRHCADLYKNKRHLHYKERYIIFYSMSKAEYVSWILPHYHQSWTVIGGADPLLPLSNTRVESSNPFMV